jgi:hypothetical protein
VCTRRECREPGIGSALTWTALADARKLEPTAVLQSSDQGRVCTLAWDSMLAATSPNSLRAELDSLPARFGS